MPGPVPKRTDKLLGKHPPERYERSTVGPLELREPIGPEPPDWMDGFAEDWYNSLRTSGQARYYTPGDWATAVVVARGIMSFIRKPSSTMLGSILEGATLLAVTEGSRRRLHIELSAEDAAEDPDLAAGEEAQLGWVTKLHAVPDPKPESDPEPGDEDAE